jgi:hypothetical protein
MPKGAEKKSTLVVYSVLLGGYEELNDRHVSRPDNVDFICFTDNPNLKSNLWDFVHVSPLFPGDSTRSQRFLKIYGHPALKPYEKILYIDNSVALLANPSVLVDDWLADADVAFPLHSFHETLLDEFDAVTRLERDIHERVSEQLFHYHADDPEVLEQKPLWTGFFARRNNPEVADFSLNWFAHVARYSRRDQLSVLSALRQTPNLTVNRVEWDNHNSSYHEWRWTETQEGRPRELSHSRTDGLLPVLAELTRLRNALARENEKVQILENQTTELLKGLQELRDYIDGLQATVSWRITAPLRALRELGRQS